MKKLFLTVALVLTAGLIFSSESPSLDGRAVVADDGVFPKGLFAKTVGYLPGDSINVTNPSNGNRVDILVIGSLDPSEGVAVLLSPEAASRLDIKKNSNNMVKLTKRSGNVDEVVNGTAVITRNVTPAPSEEPAKETPAAPVEEPVEIVETPVEEVAAAPAETPAEKVEEVPAEETVTEEVAETPAVEPSAVETPAEESLAEEPVETPSEKVTTNYPEYTPVLEDDIPEEKVEEPVEDEFANITEEVTEEPVEDELAAAPEETLEEPVKADEIPEDKVEEPMENELADVPEETAEPVETETEKVPKEIAEEPVKADDILDDEEPETAAAEPAPEKTEEEPAENEYDAIVLVPSNANPPVSANISADEVVTPSDQPVRIEPEEVEKITETPEVIEKTIPAVSGVNYVSAGEELYADKYYVQIAVYNKAEHVEQVGALYASRYPMTVIDSGAKKTVLVGPLSVDEYGIILERFKSYGFKDAFVKFIKNGTGGKVSVKAAASSNER